MLVMPDLQSHIDHINDAEYEALNGREGADERGRIGEKELARVIWALYGGRYRIVASTIDEDSRDHWDIGVINGSNKYLFDCKNNIDGLDMTWIEFLNVRGRMGSIFGKADFLAFKTDILEFLICRRLEIIELIERKCGDVLNIDPVTIKPNRPYVPYTRGVAYGSPDLIVRVPIKDITSIGKIMTSDGIKKQKDENPSDIFF